jgi:DNA-binding IclR family transcriptional regulator
LDAFSVQSPELGLSEIAKKVGLHRSTVYRLVANLERHGFLRRNGVKGRYTLGLKVFELGEILSQAFDLPTRARPYLQRLVQATGESAQLAVIERGEGLYIAKFESPRAIKAGSPVGRRIPLYRGSTGKVLLAYLPEGQASAILTAGPLPRYTKNSITDVDVFRAELAQIRRQGYAIDREEVEEGLVCVSAPVRDRTGDVIGAVSISGPRSRVDPTDPAIIGEVVKTASAISRELGYTPMRESRIAARGHVTAVSQA